MRRRQRVETYALAAVFLALVASVAAIAVVAPTDPDATVELAIVDEHGVAGGYPTTLSVGETGETTVRVTNNRETDRTFTLVATFDGGELLRETVTVPAEGSATVPVAVTPTAPGRKRLVVALYPGNGTDRATRTVRVWITVSARETA